MPSKNRPNRAARRQAERATTPTGDAQRLIYAETTILTPTEIALRDRMRRDFPFFCTYLKIKPKKDLASSNAPLIDFKFNQAQRIVWEVMKQMIRDGVPIRLVICKARQFGISTLFCAWIFWNMWRATNVKCAIAAHKKLTLQELLETMNTFYTSFPENYRPQLRQKSKGARVSKEEMYFADRACSNLITPASPDALRGPSFDIVLTTEVSSYEKPDEFYLGFMPTMSENVYSTCIMESSPKDGFFRREYERAKSGLSDFRAIFLPWWIVPELYSLPLVKRGRGIYDARTGERVTFSPEEREEQRQLTKLLHEYKRDFPWAAEIITATKITDEQMYWRQKRIESPGYDDERFNQEYPRDDKSCFELATRSAFKLVLPQVRHTVEEADDVCPEFCVGQIYSSNYDPGKTMDFDYDKVEVTFVEGDMDEIDQDRKSGLMVFRFPEAGHTYTVGGDIADDVGATVGEDDEEDDSAYSVLNVFDCNRGEQVAEWRGKIDPHDFGDVIVMLAYFYNTALICIERNNMGLTTEDRIVRYLLYPNCYRWPDFATGGGKLTNKLMWETNRRTKMLMISDFRNAVRDGLYKVRSPGLYDEMTTYIIKSGHYEPEDGCYADRIVAASLAWQAVMQTEFGVRLVLSSAQNTGPKGAKRVVHYGGGTGQPIRAVPRELPRTFDEDGGDVLRVERPKDPFFDDLPEEFYA